MQACALVRRKTLLISAAFALAALAAGWYVASPWWTLWRMREAARAGDWRMVASYVDVDAVTKSTRATIGASIAGALARAQDAENADARDAALAMAEDWRAELRQGPPEMLKGVAEAVPYSPPDLVAGWLLPGSRVRRHGLSEFEVLNPSTPSPATFIFRRHGLGWKLDEVKWGWPEGMRP